MSFPSASAFITPLAHHITSHHVTSHRSIMPSFVACFFLGAYSLLLLGGVVAAQGKKAPSVLACDPKDALSKPPTVKCTSSLKVTDDAIKPSEDGCKCGPDGSWTPACFECTDDVAPELVAESSPEDVDANTAASSAQQLASPFRNNASMWDEAYSTGSFGNPNPQTTNQASFDAAFEATGMAVRVCADCSRNQKTIVYKRITPMNGTSFSAYNNFFVTWATSAHGPNVLNRDFKLYSSVSDADADVNAWSYCNYNDFRWRIGFPRDCDPSRYQPYQWESTLHSSTRRHIAWFIKKVAAMPSPTPSPSGGGLPGAIDRIRNATEDVKDIADATEKAGKDISKLTEETKGDMPNLSGGGRSQLLGAAAALASWHMAAAFF